MCVIHKWFHKWCEYKNLLDIESYSMYSYMLKNVKTIE